MARAVAKSTRRMAAPLMSVFVGACGGGSDGGLERMTLGDTTVVANRAPLIPDTLVPLEVARYGRADGAPEYLFADIFSFGVGPDGDVYVHDRNEGIRRFAADGTYLAHVARHGEGPAEVRYVLGIDVSPDGRVAAHDLGNQRISVFAPGPSGRDYDAFGSRRPDGRPRYRVGSVGFSRDGSLWVGVHPRFPETGGVPHPRPAFVRVAEDGTFTDTVFTPGRIGVACPTLSEGRHSGGFWEDTRAPFVPKAVWSTDPRRRVARRMPTSVHLRPAPHRWAGHACVEALDADRDVRGRARLPCPIRAGGRAPGTPSRVRGSGARGRRSSLGVAPPRQCPNTSSRGDRGAVRGHAHVGDRLERCVRCLRSGWKLACGCAPP